MTSENMHWSYSTGLVSMKIDSVIKKISLNWRVAADGNVLFGLSLMSRKKQSGKKQKQMFWPLILQGHQAIKARPSRQRFTICKHFETTFLCSLSSTQLGSFEQEAAEKEVCRKLWWLSQQVSHFPTWNTISELFYFVLWLMILICSVECTHLHRFLFSQPHQFAELCKFSRFYPPGKTEVHLQTIWKRVFLNFFTSYFWNNSSEQKGLKGYFA